MNVFAKAIVDRITAAAGLLLLIPVFAVIAIWMALEDGWPPFFSQVRMGHHARPFRLVKFRSMRTSSAGARVTAGGDPRVTRIGRILRKYKIDELPQLWNVLKGEMSLVGPRPELPDFVQMSDPAWQSILEFKPGITDLATLLHRDEEGLLRGQTDTEEYYRTVVLPAKTQLSIAYLQTSNLWTDLKLVICTLYFSILPGQFQPDRIERLFSVVVPGPLGSDVNTRTPSWRGAPNQIV
jgi:lipopolysaccharide/colanic/teichoic acid biosynthesis glycosyltransferase